MPNILRLSAEDKSQMGRGTESSQHAIPKLNFKQQWTSKIWIPKIEFVAFWRLSQLHWITLDTDRLVEKSRLCFFYLYVKRSTHARTYRHHGNRGIVRLKILIIYSTRSPLAGVEKHLCLLLVRKPRSVWKTFAFTFVLLWLHS